MRAHPSFGMTMIQSIRDLFAWRGPCVSHKCEHLIQSIVTNTHHWDEENSFKSSNKFISSSSSVVLQRFELNRGDRIGREATTDWSLTSVGVEVSQTHSKVRAYSWHLMLQKSTPWPMGRVSDKIFWVTRLKSTISALKGFGIGDRCSFFHMTLIEYAEALQYEIICTKF